ncbi:hypothetical protein OIV83_003498 [Microbotryomycetes sp. JL201]|nr:hypothetical protein OIV83_003498 [Microbotryomycetes sp. JL201]
MSLLSPSSSSKPASRGVVLGLAAASVLLHTIVATKLGIVQRSLSLADESDGDWRHVQSLKFIVAIARLANWASAIVSVLGVLGLVKDHLPFVRLFTLNSILGLCADVILFAITACLAATSSTQGIASSVCQAISNADLSLDYFGYDLQSCEDRFGTLVVTLLGFVAAICLLRAWACFKLLEFHESMANKHRRRPPTLSIDTRYRYTDREPPMSGPSPKRHRDREASGHRIFLLPSSSDRKRDAATASAPNDVPMLSFTAPSPLNTSFPPQAPASTSAGTTSSSSSSTTTVTSGEPKYLVYAPVLMTAEEAKLSGAREIIVGGRRPRARTHSNHSDAGASTVTVTPTSHGEADGQSPLSAHPVNQETLLGREHEDRGKGKVA